MPPDDLSSYGRLLLDYAVQIAKRSSHCSVLPLHVALAAFEREPQRAEKEFEAGTKDHLLAIASTLTAGTSTPMPSEQTISLLGEIEGPGDEWGVLGDWIPRIFEEYDKLAPGPSPPAPARETAPATSGSEAAAMDAVLLRLFRDPLGPAIRSLAPADAGPRQWKQDDRIVAGLLDELWTLYSWLVTATPDAGDDELSRIRTWFSDRASFDTAADAAEFPPGVVPHSLGASSAIFAGLLGADRRARSSNSTLYAREMVHVAQAICSADDKVSIEETRLIDLLRVDYRSSLADTTRGSQPNPDLLGTRGPVHALLEPRDDSPGTFGSEAVRGTLRELEGLVGLDRVKREVRAFVDLAWINKLRRDRGKPTPAQNLNMAFLGNPGTGKTTVARLVGHILSGLGILGQGQLVEVDRSQLIAKYVGQTAPMVHELMERARGGVVFIDEAYSLTPVRDMGGFENEALSTLVKVMEDLRDEVVVILAGYPDLMQEFLSSNPGLQSRIATVLEFPDYSLEGLMDIFDHLCAESGRTCPPEARLKVRLLLDAARRRPRCGNGREARNVLEALERNQARRLADMDSDFITDAELAAFTAEDVPSPAPEQRGQDTSYL